MRDVQPIKLLIFNPHVMPNLQTCHHVHPYHFHFLTVNNSIALLKTVRQQRPDFIFIDMHWWLNNDVDLYQSLKADITTRYIPIVFLQPLSTTVTDSKTVAPFSSKHMHAIEQIKTHLLDNLDKTLSLDALSAIAATNRNIISRGFRLMHGCTLSTWLHQQRMQKAAELLRTTTDSISYIGFCVGYESSAGITNAFKRYYGMTPKEYRQRFLHPGDLSDSPEEE